MSEKEKVTIEAEHFGLPVTASASEIKEAVMAMRAENSALKAEVETWKERAEENQAELMAARKDRAEKKDLEAKVVIAEARAARKISKAEEADFLELFKSNKDLCLKMLAGRREQRYLENQQSLRGPFGDPPADPEAEFSAKVLEKMSANKDLKEGDAVALVQRENPDLSEKVWQAQVAKSGKKGGDE